MDRPFRVPLWRTAGRSLTVAGYRQRGPTAERSPRATSASCATSTVVVERVHRARRAASPIRSPQRSVADAAGRSRRVPPRHRAAPRRIRSHRRRRPRATLRSLRPPRERRRPPPRGTRSRTPRPPSPPHRSRQHIANTSAHRRAPGDRHRATRPRTARGPVRAPFQAARGRGRHPRSPAARRASRRRPRRSPRRNPSAAPAARRRARVAARDRDRTGAGSPRVGPASSGWKRS